MRAKEIKEKRRKRQDKTIQNKTSQESVCPISATHRKRRVRAKEIKEKRRKRREENEEKSRR